MNFRVLLGGMFASIVVLNGIGAITDQANQSNLEARYAQKLSSAIGLTPVYSVVRRPSSREGGVAGPVHGV
jgi:carbohydrate-selective porin OprB